MYREERLKKLREKMKLSGVKAVIIPSSDPHNSEYIHPHWQARKWFSGFGGSAGTLVVTLEESGLWTDFRYYIEAEESLKGSEIKLFRDGLPGVLTVSEFLLERCNHGDVVAFDGTLISTKDYKDYKIKFSNKGVMIDHNFNPVEGLWIDRPEGSNTKLYELDTTYTGESRESKLGRVREIMKQKKADYYVISSLADIAWLLNIRGGDIDFTPVIQAYLVVNTSRSILFIDGSKVEAEISTKLELSGVYLKEYDSISEYIKNISSDMTVLYMPESLNCYLSGLIHNDVKVLQENNITADLKAIKNSTEISNIKIAMEKDGVALVRFFKMVFENYRNGEFTEFSLGQKLREFRLGIDGCIDESFAPIVGFTSNGALCHYKAEDGKSKRIAGDGLLLIDSGGQYLYGTTDITRTVSLGRPTVEQILHYTLVLKGHIRLAMAKYPEGTTGGQLDILAREALWNRGLNYGHGTGHGVGYFLGVHEGPQNISSKSFKVPLKPGMITSNEPGLYIEGKHGIRLENLVLTKEWMDGLYQKFFCFETLTLFPFEIDLIDPELLTEEEIQWINSYHSEVLNRLTPFLDSEELKWLEEKCREI